MEKAELEKIIEKVRLDRSTKLSLFECGINILPDNIDDLFDLTHLSISKNNLNTLPDSIVNLGHNLTKLDLSHNCLTSLPKNIGNLFILRELNLAGNKLCILPKSIGALTNLIFLDLNDNPLTDLSTLQDLPNLETIRFMDVDLHRRYWTELSKWESIWLLDEENTEIRRTLIQQLGYERICQDLGSIILDNWREYTLLKIDGAEIIYNEGYPVDREPMLLLKMTCPSTQHIHILRVPPEMTSAEAAITWVNHGIHPDKFAVQT